MALRSSAVIHVVLLSQTLATAAVANVIWFDSGTSLAIDHEYYNDDIVVVTDRYCSGNYFCSNPGNEGSLAIVDGGYIGQGESHGGSLLIVDGGRVGASMSLAGYLTSYQRSQLIVQRGLVASDIRAYDESQVEIFGGQLGGLVQARDQTTVRIFGGTNITTVVASVAGVVEIVGSDFLVDGQPVGFGALSAQSGQLTGRLASGDTIDTTFWHSGYTDFHTGTIRLIAVPEPSAAALVGLGLLFLAVIRRATWS